MGYLAVGFDYSNLGEVGRASEYFTKAFQLREHASEREKLEITADYYSNVTGELRYNDLKQSQMEAAIKAQGVPAIEWFQAKDTYEQTFTLPETPLSGSLEVLINGLIEPSSIYAVKGRAIAVSTKLDRSDQVIIKYRATFTRTRLKDFGRWQKTGFGAFTTPLGAPIYSPISMSTAFATIGGWTRSPCL